MVRRYRAEAVNLDRHGKYRAKSQTGVAVNLISRTRGIMRGRPDHSSACNDSLLEETPADWDLHPILGRF